MNRQHKLQAQRDRRARRTRAKLFGTAERPRLSVFRGVARIHAQVIDDQHGVTLAAASDVQDKLTGTKAEKAKQVGKLVAERAQAKGVHSVVFDRGKAAYAGRVRALAEAARTAGLQF